MKFKMNYFGFVLAVAFSMALAGLCGCAAKPLPKAFGDSPNDMKISLAIQKGLANDSLFDYPDVEIITKDGVVTLKGYVSKWEAIDQAGTIVRYTKGVKELHNDLKEKQ